jgi:dTDP-4-amino-4,6-dideoxygalactose transaminase
VTDLEFVPFHRPSITQAEKDAVAEVLDSGWLTTGPRVHEFEARFATFVGARHAVALNSATAALHLALEGLAVGEGDEVIVPTYTFASCGEVVLYRRARPVLVDVDPSSLCLDPQRAAEALGLRTRAVMAVHIAGAPADIAAVQDIASATERRPAIPVIEDAAHAFPTRIASFGGRFAGTLGSAGAYSFYATKTITTGEGGMLVTDDETLAAKVRQLSLHGISRDAWKRYAVDGSWYYEIEAVGYKDNMTDLAAALGLAQLARADAMREARARVAARYLELLAPLRDRLILPSGGAPGEHAWHLFIVRLRAEVGRARANHGYRPDRIEQLERRRASAIARLREAGIGSSVHFIPLHRHPLYRRLGWRNESFPVAEEAYAGAISLPIYPDLTDAAIGRVADALRAAIG